MKNDKKKITCLHKRFPKLTRFFLQVKCTKKELRCQIEHMQEVIDNQENTIDYVMDLYKETKQKLNYERSIY